MKFPVSQAHYPTWKWLCLLTKLDVISFAEFRDIYRECYRKYQ